MSNKLTPLFRLSKNEATVLAKCHALSSLAELTRTTALPRSTVEYTIDKLLKSKLLHTYRVGKRIKYSAVPQEQVIKNILPDASYIKTYTGADDLIGIWRQIGNLPKNTRILALQPYNSFKELAKKVPPEKIVEINQKMNDKQFIFECIIHEKMTRPLFEINPLDLAKKAALSFSKRLEDIVKVPNHFLNEKAEMFIVHSRIIFIDWYKETAVEINNEHMAELLRGMFAAIKEYGERFNHGEAIERGVLLAGK